MGERLAYFFGITSPKYSTEINAYNRRLREQESEAKRQQEFSGWRSEGQQRGPRPQQMRQLDPISVQDLEDAIPNHPIMGNPSLPM